MFREKPKLRYSGLTIIMSNPSRFDTERLLSGYAGQEFLRYLSPINKGNVDLRVAEDISPLLPDTKVALLLGTQAMRSRIPLEHSLDQQRGCPYVRDGIVHVASYFPQDCFDIKNYEKSHKSRTKPEVQFESEDEEDGDEKSTAAKTSRKNYRFWLEQDTKRAKAFLTNSDSIAKQVSYAKYEIYPPIQLVTSLLAATIHKEELFLDIETDGLRQLSCIGFAIGRYLPTVYVVPINRYNGELAYDKELLCKFFAALSIACQRCTVVAHNSMFDLFVLATNYGVGFGRNIYDTMLAASRINVGIEKSLGHCVSLYTSMPYHKSEGVFEPKNEEQERALWAYNGKDVVTMKFIKDEQLRQAELRRCQSSIEQVNKSIYPYLLMSIQGMRIDPLKIDKMMTHNDAWMTQYLRICKALIGRDFLPTSSKQCVKYFHEDMGFPVLKRTATGAPSLDEKALLKLAVNNSHPLIPIILDYRRLKKESGTLKAIPWRQGDSCKVTDYPIETTRIRKAADICDVPTC
jgi:hypothetical protein